MLKKNKSKIKFITFRFGTISGVSKGMRFHTAVNKFCFNSVMGVKIPIWGKALKLYRPYLSLKEAQKTLALFVFDFGSDSCSLSSSLDHHSLLQLDNPRLRYPYEKH